MQKISNDVLAERIDNLKHIVEDGFNGVFSRQDKTNGKISEHETRLQKIETTALVQEGERQKGSRKVVVLASILTAFGVFILGILKDYFLK